MTNPTPLDVQHKPETPASLPVASSAYRDDEISLVDLWLILWKHRILVLVIMALSLAAGVALAIHKAKRYEYSATVEIGTTLSRSGRNMRPELIDTPETALAKIQNSFIPAVVQTYAAEHHLNPRRFRIKAAIPQRSQLIEVTGRGTLKQSEAYKAMISGVIGKLVADHERIMQSVRAGYQARLAQAKLKLGTLNDPTTLKLRKLGVQQNIQAGENDIENMKAQIQLIQAKSKRLDETDRIIKAEIRQIQSTLRDNLAGQKKVLTSARDEATALTTLMVSNEVMQNQRRLADLEERLEVAQPNLRNELQDQTAALNRKILAKQQSISALHDKLLKIIADAKDAIAAQKETVRELTSELDGLRETRALSSPYRSLGPVGSRRLVTVLAFGFAGALLALLAVFLVESIGQARARIRRAAS